MKTITSLPPADTLVDILKASYIDNKDSYVREPLLSNHTYETVLQEYSEDDRAKVDNFIQEHDIIIMGTDPVVFPNWSRFEDAHLPRLSDAYLQEPARETAEPIYTVFAPNDIEYDRRDPTVRVMLGFRAVIPAGNALLVTLHPNLDGKAALLSSGIIYESSTKELAIVLKLECGTGVKRREPLLRAIMITPQRLATDKFLVKQKTGDDTDDAKLVAAR